MTAPSPDRADDHGGLSRAAQSVVDILSGLESDLSAPPGGAMWVPDHELATRCEHLADHLRSAIRASDDGNYASTFVLLRTALEHHLVDELLCLADRYEQPVRDIDDLRFKEREADLAAKSEPWTAGVRDLRRVGRDRAVIVRTGMAVRNEDVRTVASLSPYYLWMKRHHGLVGRPSDQEMLDDGIIDAEQLRAEADRNDELSAVSLLEGQSGTTWH